jgi:hypothetical protein
VIPVVIEYALREVHDGHYHAEDSAAVSALMVLATSGRRHDTCCRGEDVDMVKPVAVASYLAT